MIPSKLCYVPPSVKHLGLGPTTIQVLKPGPTTPQFSNHIDASDDKLTRYDTVRCMI